MSRRVEADRLLGSVRAVVVDEIHAFAGDDRGWHLLAVLARIDEIAGREAQRVGLTATVGNPDWLLDWLVCGGEGEREVVMSRDMAAAELDLTVDFVGSVSNAARVIASLHHGEKRLVFADSRARVETLAAALRSEGATVFVSHSSLSRDDRQAAERAFAETRDCVIVATSTLELGIDVGDLDRVVQVGAPRTVASLLQRMGRTGRRAGTTRNCLFLATDDMEILVALALVNLVRDGWVEPLVAPPEPTNLVAQQLLARVLADSRVGRSTWPGSFGRVRAQAGLDRELPGDVLQWMLHRELLLEEAGLVSIGPVGEREYGKRNFMEVTSLFLTEPLLAVRWGQRDLGSVDPSSLASRDHGRPTILLGGRAWGVRDVDWSRRFVWVEPVDEPGRSRWAGSGGALSIEVCHSIRSVLVDAEPVDGALTARARQALDGLGEAYAWVQDGRTILARDSARARSRWWTFGGARANRALAAAFDAAGLATVGIDDLGVGFRSTPPLEEVRAVAQAVDPASAGAAIDARRFDSVKFGSCLPDAEIARLLAARDRDQSGVAMVVREPSLSASL